MGLELSAVASLSAKLDAATSRLEQIHQAITDSQVYRAHPASALGQLSNVASNTGPVTQLCDGPTGGMVWEIRRISFAPAPGDVAAGGTLILYRGLIEIARTTSVPNFLTFSGYQLIVQPNEQINGIWFGATTPGTLLVDISAIEYPQRGRVEVQA